MVRIHAPESAGIRDICDTHECRGCPLRFNCASGFNPYCEFKPHHSVESKDFLKLNLPKYAMRNFIVLKRLMD